MVFKRTVMQIECEAKQEFGECIGELGIYPINGMYKVFCNKHYEKFSMDGKI